MTAKFLGHFACWKCEGNAKNAAEHENNVCNVVTTVREFINLGNRVSTGELLL